MGIYNSHQPYPKWFDEEEKECDEKCEYGHGKCFEAGYCLKEVKNND